MVVLSIIIPIYKVEKYIAKCLTSIVSQTKEREDVEIILVDDGSPDKSISIASNIIKNIDNVTVYQQTNKGLSEARNKGLDKAKGEYIWFVDSDDSITDGCIKGILESLRTYSPDLLQLNYQKVYENGNPTRPYYSNISNKISGKDVIRKGNLPTPAQFAIYRRQFLLDNSLKFYPGILHEDAEFKPRVTYLAETIVAHNPIVYNYLQRERGSIMNSFKYRNASDTFVVLNNLCKFLNNNVDNDYKPGFRRIISMYFNNIMNGYSKLSSKDKSMVLCLIKQNKHLYREMILSRRLKYILEGIILHINPKIALKLYSKLS